MFIQAGLNRTPYARVYCSLYDATASLFTDLILISANTAAIMDERDYIYSKSLRPGLRAGSFDKNPKINVAKNNPTTT